MKVPGTTKCVYEFASFRLSPAERLLLKREARISLPPKVFDTLVALVERSGHLIEKDELFRRVWPDTFVGDATLARNIFLLRNALGRGFIETVSKRGYRFTAPVTIGDALLLLSSSRRSNRLGSNIETASGPKKNEVNRSFAVLPFKSLAAGNDHDYLGLGMADALITRLSNTRRIIVRPTSSVLKYTDGVTDPAAAGREMNVDAVLDGSLQRIGDRLRLTVQLVNVNDGESVWAGKFDESFTDIFSLQDSLSRRVAAELALKLTSDERKELTKRHTVSVAAYDAYLKGRYFWNKRSKRWFQKSLESFDAAIQLDPHFALAHSGRGDALTLMGGWEVLSPLEALPEAKTSYRTALNIDPTLAEAHAGLAHAQLHGLEWENAERGFIRSIDLNPGYASAHQWYSEYLVATKRFDEAIEEILTAHQLEPMSLLMNADVGWILYHAGRYDEAVAQLKQLIEIDPDYWYPHYFLGQVYTQLEMYSDAIDELHQAMELSGRGPLSILLVGPAYARAGRKKEAREIINRLIAISKKRFFSPSRVVSIYAALGEKDKAFEWLERAFKAGDAHLILINVDPALKSLRDDPRFKSLVKRMKIPG